MRESEYLKELRNTLYDLTIYEARLNNIAKSMNVQPDEMMDASGKLTMLPIVCAKANVLAALAIVDRGMEPDEVSMKDVNVPNYVSTHPIEKCGVCRQAIQFVFGGPGLENKVSRYIHLGPVEMDHMAYPAF